MFPFVNCTSFWEVSSASNKENRTPLPFGIIFFSVAVTFTSCAEPEGVKALLWLNLTWILAVLTSKLGESSFATPATPEVAL